MQLAAVIQFVWQALGLWTGTEVAEEEQTAPLPTSTSTVVVYSSATEPSFTMPPLLSFSSLFSLMWMFVFSIMYLSKLPARMLASASLSYYKGLAQRQEQELQELRAQHKADETGEKNLETAEAQYTEDLRLIVEQHAAQLQSERQDHEAEIERLKIEHSGDLQHLQQTQEKMVEQQAATAARAVKNHEAEIETLKIEHSRDLQHLQQTQEKASEEQAALVAQASRNRNAVENALRKEIGDAHQACRRMETIHRQLQINNDSEIERLRKNLEITQSRYIEAEKDLREQKFVGQDEWDKLRADKHRAECDAHGFRKERDIYHTQLREVCGMSAKQSAEVTAHAQAAATAAQRVEDMQLQLTRKDEELAKTSRRNEALGALVRKVQAVVDERDEALSKAEEQAARSNRELERLKKKQPRKQVTATRPVGVKEDDNAFERFTSMMQELHNANAKAEKLMGDLTTEKARVANHTEELNTAREAFKALNRDLTVYKLKALTVSTELDRVKVEFDENRKSSAVAQSNLTAARDELSHLKGADARANLAVHAASIAEDNLTKVKVELENSQAENIDLKAELRDAKAELLGFKAEQMGREAALQKCQEMGKWLELEVNNLRRTNATLDLEIVSLGIRLNAAQAENTSMRQNQQHEAVVGTAQVHPVSLPATVENQDPYNSEDDAMGEDEYELWENAWPGMPQPEVPNTAGEDQKMEEGQNAATVLHKETPPSAVPAISSGTRELDDIDLDLLGETDDNEAEQPIVPATSKSFTAPQFNFMAPQNIAWPTPNTRHSHIEFKQAPPEGPQGNPQLTEDEKETARLIEEEMAKDLGNGEWSEYIPEAQQSAPELIYGDYLPATPQVPQQSLSSLLYGAKPPVRPVQKPSSVSMSPGQTIMATPPKTKIPGLFCDTSAEIPSSISQTPGTLKQDPKMSNPSFHDGVFAAHNSSTFETPTDANDLQLEWNDQQVSANAANSVRPKIPSPPKTSDLPVFDPTVMSLNEWTIPQELETQSSMANFVPELPVPTSEIRPSPFTAKPRSKEPMGAFTGAMNDVKNTPSHTPSTTKARSNEPMGAFSRAMYDLSNTPSHTLVEGPSIPSFLPSLLQSTGQTTPTVSQPPGQALRPESQYSPATDPDPRSRRRADHNDTSGSQHPRFDLGVMSLPGGSGQLGYSQISPHYVVQNVPTTQHQVGPTTPEPIRRGFASLPTGNLSSMPDAATLSALLGHRTPAATAPVAGSSSGSSIPILHPRNPHAESAEEVKRKKEIEDTLRGEVVIDLGDSSDSDEDETEEQRKARKLAELAPGGVRKIAKMKKRIPAL
ncbi:hypothetical protein MMC18_000559 [Xylographa bjoerkii]|nr:hypothetical protein [Xylographa bjoerkii]